MYLQSNVFSRAGFALVAAWCSSLAAQVILEIVCELLLPQLHNSPYYYWVVYIISVYMISLPLFVIICGGRGTIRPVDAKMKITVRDFLRLMVVCISLTYIFNFVGVMVNNSISEMIGHTVVNPLEALEDTSPLLMFICTGIISPFTEELMFRGVLIKKLRPYGDKLALWFSALAFGLYHGNFSQFFYAAALGFVFGAIAIKTNRLIYTILLHIAINISGSFIIPNIVGSDNLVVAAIGALLLLGLIIYGIVLGVKMLPHLKTGQRFIPGDIKLMISNPGAICYLALCCFMFYGAVFAR